MVVIGACTLLVACAGPANTNQAGAGTAQGNEGAIANDGATVNDGIAEGQAKESALPESQNQTPQDITPTVDTTPTVVTVEEAKEIALRHANLTNDQVNFIKASKEYDDGIEIYDVEFYMNTTEYNYEINANNGQVISFDKDIN